VRRAWPLVLATVLLLASTSTAVASNWGAIYDEPTSVSFQDDSLMSYQWDTNLSSDMRTASDRTLTGSYATTDLNIVKFADGHRDDVNNHYAIGSMPIAGLIGYHDCVYWVSFSRTRCRHGHIRYKNPQPVHRHLREGACLPRDRPLRGASAPGFAQPVDRALHVQPGPQHGSVSGHAQRRPH
jgi:hypothetical protein